MHYNTLHFKRCWFCIPQIIVHIKLFAQAIKSCLKYLGRGAARTFCKLRRGTFSFETRSSLSSAARIDRS